MNDIEDKEKQEKVNQVLKVMEAEIIDAKDRIHRVSEGLPEITKNEKDFDFARKNLTDMITKGNQAFGELLEFAKDTGHPRAYEVLGALIKNLTDANTKLLELHKTQETTKNPKTAGKTVNNAIFVGTTNDLNEVIKQVTGNKR